MATNPFNLYPSLPGVLAEFKDGGLVLRNDPNPPQTQSIVFLGTAVDGPVGEPVAVDAATVETVFGRAVNPNGTSNGSTLVKAFEQAYTAGCRDIRLVRISGDKATSSIKASSISFTTEKSNSEILGSAPGNDADTFTLSSNEIQVNSVQIQADRIIVSSNSYEVTNGDDDTSTKAVVAIDANSVKSNSKVYITYTKTDGTAVTDSFDANGSNAEYAIEYIPAINEDNDYSIELYANGVIVNSEAFEIDATDEEAPKFVLKPGYVDLNSILEISYTYTNTASEDSVIEFESVYAGSVYNETTVAVQEIVNTSSVVIGKKVVITKPTSKQNTSVNEAPMEFSSLDYPTFDLLKNAINNNALNNVVVAKVNTRYSDVETSDLTIQAATALTGGADSTRLTKEQAYTALQKAYENLENYSVDFVVPVGVYADSVLAGKYKSFAYQLSLACAVMTYRNKTTLGVIGMTPVEDTSLATIKTKVNDSLSKGLDFFMRDKAGNELKDSDGNRIDLGRYISVLAGPDVLFGSNRFGIYSDSAASVYAAMLTTMRAQSATTNKRVPGILGLRYNLSSSQLDQLTNARYVTLKTKNNGAEVVVVDGVTAAQGTSDYRRLSTMRIVKDVVDQVREVADPFIGEPNEVAQRNALSAAIEKRLGVLREQGEIMNYTFNIIATPQMQLVGQAQVELTIVPAMELRQITTVISLRPSL